MKIYTHNSSTPSLDFGLIIKTAIIITFLMGLVTVSHGADLYECELQEDGVCLIYLENVLPETASVDDALAYCEKFNGTYIPEEDTCEL